MEAQGLPAGELVVPCAFEFARLLRGPGACESHRLPGGLKPCREFAHCDPTEFVQQPVAQTLPAPGLYKCPHRWTVPNRPVDAELLASGEVEGGTIRSMQSQGTTE